MKLRPSVKTLAITLSLVIAFLFCAQLSAYAATITVNTTLDENGTGANCSLREAIIAANTDSFFGGCTAGSGADIINFDSVVFATPQTITLTVSRLDVPLTSVITINGTGANMLTIQNSIPAGTTSQTFLVNSSANLSVSGVTITGANVLLGGGGGFLVQNSATLTITGVVITGNTVERYGAGILASSASATVNIINSTISNNTAGGSSFGGGGGAIDSSGTLNITNSTISGNTKNEATNNGGGVYVFSGTATITNSTITNNTAAGAGSAGGVFRAGGTVTVRNTIIAANTTTPDVAGAFTSSGYNLIGNVGTATGFTATGDQTGVSNVNAGLAPLGNYGGPTPTHALTLTSFALDKGNNFGSTTDQRGFTRPFDDPGISNAVGGNGTDIGAYERQSPTAASVSVSGRVNGENGRGIPGALVFLTLQNGEVLTARTSSFGYFRFNDIEAGQVCVINVTAKSYLFDPFVLNVTGDIADLNLTPLVK